MSMKEFFQSKPKTLREHSEDVMGLLPGQGPQYCPSMTWKQRLYGFGICVGAGVLCGALSTLFIFFLDIVMFAVFYTLGNLCAIGSSLFLSGPLRQLKSMCQPVRLLCTLAYFLFMGLTLFAALYLQSGALTLVFVICQMCALLWYMLSYIPYARDLCCTCFKSATGADAV